MPQNMPRKGSGETETYNSEQQNPMLNCYQFIK